VRRCGCGVRRGSRRRSVRLVRVGHD
jgi:hypothetical protein